MANTRTHLTGDRDGKDPSVNLVVLVIGVDWVFFNFPKFIRVLLNNKTEFTYGWMVIAFTVGSWICFSVYNCLPEFFIDHWFVVFPPTFLHVQKRLGCFQTRWWLLFDWLLWLLGNFSSRSLRDPSPYLSTISPYLSISTLAFTFPIMIISCDYPEWYKIYQCLLLNVLWNLSNLMFNMFMSYLITFWIALSV